MILPVVQILSGLLPVAAAVHVLRSLSKTMMVLLVYFVIAFLFDISLMILGLHGINNLWLMHLFTPIEYALFVWVLSDRSQRRAKRAFRVSIPLFIGFWLVAAALFERATEFNTISHSVEAGILVLVASFALFEINRGSSGSPLQDPYFWIASAALLYFAASVLIYALSNVFLSMSMELLLAAYNFKIIVNAIANVVYAGGFLCLRPR
jgi:hypothetical protein